jgi:hypothetical protein
LSFNGAVSLVNLRTFISAVHGIYIITDKSQQLVQSEPSIGFMNDQGIYIIRDETVQAEIMKQFLFMHDNKKDHCHELEKKRSSFSPANPNNRLSNSMTFKPKITPKSRNLAESYKKTFVGRLTSLLSQQSLQGCDDPLPRNFASMTQNQPLQESKSLSAFDHLYQQAAYLSLKS